MEIVIWGFKESRKSAGILNSKNSKSTHPIVLVTLCVSAIHFAAKRCANGSEIAKKNVFILLRFKSKLNFLYGYEARDILVAVVCS